MKWILRLILSLFFALSAVAESAPAAAKKVEPEKAAAVAKTEPVKAEPANKAAATNAEAKVAAPAAAAAAAAAPAAKAPIVASTTVNDIAFDNAIKLNNESLLFKGAGLRRKFIFNVYVVGLYVSEKSTDPLSNDSSRMIRLVLKRNVGMGDMIKALDDGIKSNTTEDVFAKTAPAREQFKSMFKEDDFKNGSELKIASLPSKGVEISLNGQTKGIISDANFSKAIFDVWLGNSPVDASLKKKLLGA